MKLKHEVVDDQNSILIHDILSPLIITSIKNIRQSDDVQSSLNLDNYLGP